MEREQERNDSYTLDAGIFSVSRMLVFVKSPTFEACTLAAAKVRLEALQDAWAQVRLSESRIASANDLLVNVEMQRRIAEAEASYFAAYAALEEKIVEKTPSAGSAGLAGIAGAAGSAGQPIEVKVSLPFAQHDVKNTWGSFDGDITKWQGFRDRFVAAIHDNDRIAPSYKFSYLKASLSGRAAKTLGEWQLTDKNYSEAWKRMNDIFTKKYATCRELLRNFFKLPALQGAPRAGELQKMANTTYETLRQLEAQGIPTEHWDMIIIHVLHEKLDPETACKWEEVRTSEEPTSKEFCGFLDKRAEALQGAVSRKVDQPSALQQRSIVSRVENIRAGSSNAQRQETSDEKKIFPCHKCKSLSHPMWRCPQFAVLSLRAKQDVVKEKALCSNCLKTGHTPNKCFQGPCFRCPGKQMHNSALCPMRELEKGEAKVYNAQEKGRKRGRKQEGENKQKRD